MKLFLLLLIVIFIIVLVLRYFNKKSDVEATAIELQRYLPEVFVVADIETTGLDPEKHEIIEIAAIRVRRDSDIHDTFSALVKPSKKIPKKITEITGITDDMLQKDGEPIEETMKQFISFIGNHRLVFYNAPFDMSFLNKSARQVGIVIENPISDALEIARIAWPNRRSYKLVDLAKDANLSTVMHHRAIKDCELTMRIFCAAAIDAKRI